MADPIPNWNMEPRDCSLRSVWEKNGPVYVTPPRCDPFLDLLAETSWERFVELGHELLSGPLSSAVLNRKLNQRRAELAPLVAEDPTMDAVAWENAVRTLPAIFDRVRSDFQALLARGLIDEPTATEPMTPPPPPPDDLDAVTEDTGLHVVGITNFEFATAPLEPQPSNVFAYGDSLATYVPSWNTSSPISGGGDLRFDFMFRQQPGTYDEYAGVGILTPEPEIDITGYGDLVLTLLSSTARTVRIRLHSPAYLDTWGDIWSEFGVDLPVRAGTQTLSIALDTFSYPAWAKEPWAAGQGFTSLDTQARTVVLERFNGLIFAPTPQFDGGGALVQDPEAGYLQVDNLYFR
jgi:hypothetical protein